MSKTNWSIAWLRLGVNMGIRIQSIPNSEWWQVIEVERMSSIKDGFMAKRTRMGWVVYRSVDSFTPVFRFPSSVALDEPLTFADEEE